MAATDVLVTDPVRAYVEYRLFTSVVRHERFVRAVEIRIEHRSTRHKPFSCTVRIGVGASGWIKTQARSGHLTGAIDRAAGRAAWLLERHARQPVHGG